MRFSVNDLFACVNQLFAGEWQTLWSQCTSNKLYSVQPVIDCNTKTSLSRYETVVVNRLGIGHTGCNLPERLTGEVLNSQSHV